jgi:hypothetical protein
VGGVGGGGVRRVSLPLSPSLSLSCLPACNACMYASLPASLPAFLSSRFPPPLPARSLRPSRARSLSLSRAAHLAGTVGEGRAEGTLQAAACARARVRVQRVCCACMRERNCMRVAAYEQEEGWGGGLGSAVAAGSGVNA